MEELKVDYIKRYIRVSECFISLAKEYLGYNEIYLVQKYMSEAEFAYTKALDIKGYSS